jgi:hypothetical protein
LIRYKYHIIRPVGLADGDGSAQIHNITKGFLPSNKISRADVAKYLVDNLKVDKQGFSSICN